ncbi:hypothetical protein V6N13_043253 [Hibiscus sabdariffa]|uniref:Uncharacterized protein n=1 Tax=Hibiscus sabdariffa TaxID=183260 RepID=A0ABR2G264_9ROSI
MQACSSSQDQENLPLKAPKLQSVDEASQAKEGFQSAEDPTHETSGNDDSSVPERQFVDWKGKGILVEEEKDSDDDNHEDASDGENETEGESDLSDDPLAEVDLENILPSRTRRSVWCSQGFILRETSEIKLKAMPDNFLGMVEFLLPWV